MLRKRRSYRLRSCVVGLIRIAEGAALLLSLGSFYPTWESRFLLWLYDRRKP